LVSEAPADTVMLPESLDFADGAAAAALGPTTSGTVASSAAVAAIHLGIARRTRPPRHPDAIPHRPGAARGY
jgi:hypothetical protein